VRPSRKLQTRLFASLLGAIVLAIVASTFTWWLTHPSEPPFAAWRTATRTIGHTVSRDWDDPNAVNTYLESVNKTVGLDLRVRRDVENLEPAMKGKDHWPSVAFDGRGHGLIPIVRDHQLVGAVEFDSGGPAPRLLNVFVSLGAAVLALAVAARAVARRLAWPLEEVAKAAERFGGGELATRTRLDEGRRAHWVAAEVRDVARAFDTMAERIEGVVRDQRELLGAISHELRSPLGRARIALEIARDRATRVDPKEGASFDEVERQLSEVDAILGDLLAAARAGLSDLRPKPTALLAWLRARIAAEPVPPAIELVAPDLEADDVKVELEPALMNRALHNLFANARAHGHPADRAMEVHVTREREALRIVVRDAGPGFPPDLLARAFDPFVKGDPARTPGAASARDGSGSGLGLALVRRIVEAHGGRAFARNVEEGGAVVGAEVGMDLPLTSPLTADASLK
jgi:signal transduction histidine kinase